MAGGPGSCHPHSHRTDDCTGKADRPLNRLTFGSVLGRPT
jgi:hypothetical protein